MNKTIKNEDEKPGKKKINENKDLENQIASLEDQLKRALADYQNLERRVLEERGHSIKYANEQLLKQLLPSFDNLYLAEKYLQDEGIKLTVQKLTESLEQVGVKRIAVDGKFDPTKMEAIDVSDGEKDMVVEELRPGFVLFDKVIRPAQVRVGNGKQN